MIIYEASSRCLGGPGSMQNLILFQVLTGKIPHSGCDNAIALSNIRAGKTPERPSGGIPDPVWQLLEKCWSMKHLERPSATQIYNALSRFRSVHPVIEHLPERLKLWAQSITISFAKAKKRQFFVEFRYRDRYHTTSLTTKSEGGDEYTWFAFRLPPSSLLPLSLSQGPSGNLVDRNGRKASQTGDHLRSALQGIYGHIQERQGLRDRGIHRKSITAE